MDVISEWAFNENFNKTHRIRLTICEHNNIHSHRLSKFIAARKKAIILSYKKFYYFNFTNEFLLEILIKQQEITLLARIFISWKSPSITLWTWLNVNDEWVKEKEEKLSRLIFAWFFKGRRHLLMKCNFRTIYFTWEC